LLPPLRCWRPPLRRIRTRFPFMSKMHKRGT